MVLSCLIALTVTVESLVCPEQLNCPLKTLQNNPAFLECIKSWGWKLFEFEDQVFLIWPLKHSEAVELKEVKLGETVTLICNLSVYSDIHWLKMSEGRPMALIVTSLKHNGELSVVWNYNETHFEGFMEKQMTGLRILHISDGDLATYNCATLYQKRLDFDKGVQLYTNQQSINTTFVQGPDGLSLHYQVFVAVLCFGLLGMLLSVLVVHMKTRAKNKPSSRQDSI